MISKRIALPIITVWSLLCSLQLSPFVVPPGHDREIFRYIGMLIHQGGMPYRDVFDHKPPIIYLLAALGHGAGPYGLWLVETAFALIAASCVFLLAQRSRWVFPILYALLFSSLYWNPAINQGGGLTRGFSACVAMIALSLFYNEHRPFEIGVGGLIAIVFCLQQEQLVGLIPFMLLTLKRRPPEFRIRILTHWIIGAGAVIVPTILWLLTRGAWTDFIRQAFRFNLEVYGTIMPPAIKLLLGLRAFAPFFPAMALVILIGIALHRFIRELGEPIVYAGVSILALHFATALASGHWFPHYSLGGLPYWVVLIGSITTAVSQWKRQAAVPCCLLLSWLYPHESAMEFIGRLQTAMANRHAPAYYQAFSPLAKSLITVQHQSGQLYVFRFPAAVSLYTDYNILAPSPWIFTTIWDSYPQWDAQGHIFQSIIDSLEKNHTRYIIDSSSQDPIREPLQGKWNAYISAHYHHVAHTDGGTIFYERIQ